MGMQDGEMGCKGSGQYNTVEPNTERSGATRMYTNTRRCREDISVVPRKSEGLLHEPRPF